MRAKRVSLLALGCLSRNRAPRPIKINIQAKDKENKSKAHNSFTIKIQKTMKEIYKQLTKATALVALFLMIGTNAWAKVEWIGTSITNFPTTGAQCNPSTWYKIGSTGISVKGPLIKYNSTNKCIDMGFVQGQNDPRGTFGFLKSPDQDRFVTLVFQTFKEKERVIVTEVGGSSKLQETDNDDKRNKKVG